MITLHQYYADKDVPNLSPFCLKLETWLRMAGVEYQSRYTWNPGKGPLGKLPAIDLNGRRIPDSTLCIDALRQEFQIDLDHDLSAEQKAVAQAFKVMTEERLYWALVYSRWIDPTGWAWTRDRFFGKLPRALRAILPAVAQRQIRRDLRGQGMGRHAPEQVYRFASDDLRAISTWLGFKPYFMGDEPTDIDATLYGLLAQLFLIRDDLPLRRVALPYENLRTYCERMQRRYFPAE